MRIYQLLAAVVYLWHHKTEADIRKAAKHSHSLKQSRGREDVWLKYPEIRRADCDGGFRGE